MPINLVTQHVSIQTVSMLDRYVTSMERGMFAHNLAAVVCEYCTSKGALEGQIQSPREVTLAQCCSS